MSPEAVRTSFYCFTSVVNRPLIPLREFFNSSIVSAALGLPILNHTLINRTLCPCEGAKMFVLMSKNFMEWTGWNLHLYALKLADNKGPKFTSKAPETGLENEMKWNTNQCLGLVRRNLDCANKIINQI